MDGTMVKMKLLIIFKLYKKRKRKILLSKWYKFIYRVLIVFYYKGVIYEGEFFKGQFHGEGILKYPNVNYQYKFKIII